MEDSSNNNTISQASAVHFLYKPPEIPANMANAAVTVSATYRKRKDPVNTGSIPVSATMFSIPYGLCGHTRSHISLFSLRLFV
jgi:hypothetical protein